MRSLLVALLLGGCSAVAPVVHPITYPWRCGEPRFDCYVLGYEVRQDELVARSFQFCIDGVKRIIPSPGTNKGLIVCN